MISTAISKVKTVWHAHGGIYYIIGLAWAGYLIPTIHQLAQSVFRYYKENIDTHQTATFDPIRYRHIKTALQKLQPKPESLFYKKVLLEILEYRFQISSVPPNLAIKELFQLRSLPFIPKVFDEYSHATYKCALSDKPVRYPVRDPGNISIIYERAVIEKFLQKKSVSPKTGKPLKNEELIQALEIQNHIERRLLIYEENIENFIFRNLPNL